MIYLWKGLFKTIINKKFFALLDSGAAISLCSQKAFREIPSMFIRPKNIHSAVNITTLDGTKIKIQSSADVQLTINKEQLRYKFLITEANFSKDYDFILGFDFLSMFQCQMDFQSKTITIKNAKTYIYKYAPHQINVVYNSSHGRLAHKIKIPPQKSAIVQIKSDLVLPVGSTVLVDPLPSRHNIELHRSVCSVTKSGSIPIIINNLSNNTFHLNKNTKIATIDTNIDILEKPSISEIRKRELKLSDFDLSGIPPEGKSKLQVLLMEYADVFSTSLKTIGKCTLEAPPIELTDFTPIQCRPFPVPLALRDTLKNEIQQLAEAGIIEKSNSRYSFPLILVKKKIPNQYRLVIDFRRLNQVTVSSNYKLPLISDILNSLRGAKYYCTLDANSSFHQIKLRDEDKHLTAFSSPYGHFQYKYLTFGMKNSAQVFQETADTVLNGLQPENIAAYIDDVIIPATSINDSIRKLRLVLDRFRQYGLTLNPAKCRFLQPSIKYLGHIVDKEGLKPLPETLTSIKDFPVPNTVRKLRRFIGLANYYRSFIDGFSHIITPLTDLTKKSSRLQWTDKAQEAFDTIKNKLLSDVMLKHPNFDKMFYLNTDASGQAVGASLLQKDENGILRPISYFSSKLKPHERKWPAIQLEAYAIIQAIRHYKIYLYGRKFTILSDCKSLNYLVKLDSPANRLSRWLLELSEYDFAFEHIKGKNNFLCDLLSRDVLHTINALSSSINSIKVDIPDIDTIRTEQRKDPSLKLIIDYLEDNSQKCPSRTDNYFLDNGLLKHIACRNNRAARDDYLEQIVIPAKLIPYILEGSETVHFAFQKNYRTIQEKFFWKNMYRDVKNFSNSCTTCIERKGFLITKSPLMKFETPTQPMELISLDILGPLPISLQGNKYVLTVIDHFTKYSKLFALSDITAKTVAAKLFQVITTYGVPKEILTDLGRNFQSQLMNELAQRLNIRKLRTTPYRPSTNSQSERINTSIKNSLTCLSQTISDWDTYIDYYNFIYNNSYHETTQEKPSFLMFNRDLNLPFHLLENQSRPHFYPCENFVEENLSKMHYVYRQVYKNLEEASKKQADLRNKIAKTKTFRIGEKVYLHTPVNTKSTGRSFAKHFSGPYRVQEKHSEVNYTIIHTNKPFCKPIRVHVDRMFAYEERRPDLQIPHTPDKVIKQPTQTPLVLQDVSKNFSLFDEETDDYIPSFNPGRKTQKSISDEINGRGQCPQPQTETLSDSSPDNETPTQPKQTVSPFLIKRVNNDKWKCERKRIETQLQSDKEKTSESLSNKIINWAVGNPGSTQDKNIIDKVSDVLADKFNLAGQNKINTILLRPQKTRIFYNKSLNSNFLSSIS